MTTTHGNRYAALMREWAGKALDHARDAPTLVESSGLAVSLGAAAAGRLLGRDGDPTPSATTLIDTLHTRGVGPVKFADTFGFSRPAYYPLLVHLHLATAVDDALAATVRATVGRQTDRIAAMDPELRLWWALCLHAAASGGGDAALQWTAEQIVDAVATAPGEAGALHRRRDLDDLLDAWTFRELAGLHALGWMAIRTGNPAWRERVREIARAHQAVTQPDYTTYQPWGVFAFLMAAETIPFGEQQLHDAVTNLHVEHPGAGLVTGMLLADAVRALETTGESDRSA